MPVSWGCYQRVSSQGIAQTFEINDSHHGRKLLIATQKSTFKEALVAEITQELKGHPVYIKVIDITTLPATREADWNTIVVINIRWLLTMLPSWDA
ncbi:hypothetical protein CSA56_16350 [candidate division KSB3 bacterium]|uniref:Uncharacterized protein n=1 Tax=candidate division KSB3 bacterium TaxID=2044937 RepID=A0A2G6K900_9BACT|nr:MAG: hypothetical protein CSA56_16350 [candidate division KSB3 bacterium]